MRKELNEIATELLSLPANDRAELADRLMGSVEDDTSVDQAVIDKLWAQEYRRRIREIETGKAKLIPGDQALREVRLRFGKPVRRR